MPICCNDEDAYAELLTGYLQDFDDLIYLLVATKQPLMYVRPFPFYLSITNGSTSNFDFRLLI